MTSAVNRRETARTTPPPQARPGRAGAAEAEPLYREALTAKQETLGDKHEGTLRTLNNLAVLLVQQQKLEQAAPMFDEALDGFREAMGVEHPETISLVRNYGQVPPGSRMSMWHVACGMWYVAWARALPRALPRARA